MMLKQKVVFIALMGVLTGWSSQAMAYAPEEELLKIKGYSPEVIETADLQRSRQEWRQPAPARETAKERFWHNVYYGNWGGGVDAFGRSVIGPR